MRKNIILVPPCNTYGDVLSIIGMCYYLLEHYSRVHIFIINNQYEYYVHFFSSDPQFGNRIFIVRDPSNMISESVIYEYDVVNTHTADWNKPMYDFNCDKIEPGYYFNCANPLYTKLAIPDDLCEKPNGQLPNLRLEINHLFYYKLVGLNNKVRMDYFHYARNPEEEERYLKNILGRYGLRTGDKFNCVNIPHGTDMGKNIKNGLPCVNISDAAPFIGYLSKVVELAEEIHLVEGCNTNFIYHCQYKGILDIRKEVNFHIWCRNRNWPQFNLDWAWKMMSEPKLQNWRFIYDETI